jgi:hypothetical protein
MSRWSVVTVRGSDPSDISEQKSLLAPFRFPSLWSRVKPYALNLALLDHYPEGVALLILNFADDYTDRCEICCDLTFVPDPESRLCEDCQCSYHPSCQPRAAGKNKCSDCLARYVPCAECNQELWLGNVQATFKCLHCKKAFHRQCHPLHTYEDFLSSCHDCYMEQQQNLQERASCMYCHKVRLPTHECQDCRRLVTTQPALYTEGPRHAQDLCHTCFVEVAHVPRCHACWDPVPASSISYGNCQQCQVRNARLERAWRCDFCSRTFHASCSDQQDYPLLEYAPKGNAVCMDCVVYLNSEQYSHLTEPQLRSLQ